jgi:Ca2+-binding RTX toxin-like protein
MVGNGGSDALYGGAGNDMIVSGSGRDMAFGGDGNDDIVTGAGSDMVFGDAGNDRILTGEGNDFVDAGAGNDQVMGGDGDDVFLAAAGDGADSYYGGDGVSDNGSDTLDMSAIMTNIEANLGTGIANRGFVKTAGTQDLLQGVENIVTGSGNDTITASRAVNVMDGGAGNDTFVFRSASDANGDTIENFEAGDRIDLSSFMNGSVQLVNGPLTAAGQVSVSFEQVDGEDVTVLHGNVDGDPDSEFSINIKGHHNLTGSNFA